MKTRCYNLNHSRYAEWGGRGIAVCEHWRTSFENFIADMGEVPSPYHTLDRINPEGNYEPANCRWATRTEQQRNRRDSTMLTFKDRTQNIYDWADELNMPMAVIRNRTKAGWSVERTLTAPVETKYSRYGLQITFNGEKKNISQWATALGLHRNTLYRRLTAGQSLEQIIQRAKPRKKRI